MKTAPNRVSVHRGAAQQAIDLLRWWSLDATDEPDILEMIQQSKECARDLAASLKQHDKRPRRT